MQSVTGKVLKWIALFVLLCLSLTCYAMGNASGAIILIVLGFAFEGVFWLFGHKLLTRKKPKVPSHILTDLLISKT